MRGPEDTEAVRWLEKVRQVKEGCYMTDDTSPGAARLPYRDGIECERGTLSGRFLDASASRGYALALLDARTSALPDSPVRDALIRLRQTLEAEQ